MVLRLIFGLIVGSGATFFIAQKDPWVKQKIGDAFTQILADTFECQVSGSVVFFDLLYPRLFMSDFSMKAYDGSWEWSTHLYRAGFSWRDVIKHRCIAWWTQMKGLQAHSKMKGVIPAIFPHVQDLMNSPVFPIPLELMEAKIRTASLTISGGEGASECKWYADAQREGAAFCLKVYIRDGDYWYKKNAYFSSLSGIVTITTPLKHDASDYAVQLDMKGDLAHLEYPTCFLTGHWYQNRGRFQLQSYDRSLRINPLVIGQKDDDTFIEAHASFPLSYMYKLFFNTDTSPFEGSGSFQFKGSLSEDGSSDGSIVCEEVIHASLSEPCIFNTTFSKRGHKWGGMWDVKHGLHHALHGFFEWLSSDQKGTASFFNETALSVPYYPQIVVSPYDAQLHLSYDGVADTIDGSYSVMGHDLLQGTPIESDGSYTYDAQRNIKGHGTVGPYYYEGGGSLAFPYLSSLKISSATHQPVLEWLYDEAARHYQSVIDISLLQHIVTSLFHCTIPGEGKVKCTGSQKGNQIIVKGALEQATIRLPQTFNFINGATVDLCVDFLQKRLSFKNLFCSLHNGTVKSAKGTVWFNEKGEIPFMHVPLFIDKCLVTAKQDLFAVISGNLLFSKNAPRPACVSGILMIDRAQLKENLFSEQLQKKLFSAADGLRDYKEVPFLCDISIATKDPIRVDTPFLQANAHACLTAQGSVYKPIIEGSIHVPSGAIKFPYKPLTITKGAITFVKEQPLNPFVELVAKNKIKNHTVMLNVTGSLHDTTVLLEATPPLSEEQIIGLLIAGSHDHSLDVIIPALLMQNVTHYIFSSHKSNFFERYIKPWMKQVNVGLKPNFSDQSGRGGLRGTLEVVVNDRWRALIEKNFSLTEDTHFELEYIVADDITLRVIRDERRDVGGEIEMKWKF